MGGLISTVLASDVNEAGQLIQELAHTFQTGDWNSLLENEPFWKLAETVRQSPKIISEICGIAESLLSESVSTGSVILRILLPTLSGTRMRLLVTILKIPTVYAVLRLESFWRLLLDRDSFQAFFRENVYFSDIPAQLLALLEILRNPLVQQVLRDLSPDPYALIQRLIEDSRTLLSILRQYGSPFPRVRGGEDSNVEVVPVSGRVLGMLTWFTSDPVVNMLQDPAFIEVLSLDSTIRVLESFRQCMIEISTAQDEYNRAHLPPHVLRINQSRDIALEHVRVGYVCGTSANALLKFLTVKEVSSLLSFLKSHARAVQGVLLRIEEIFLAASLTPRRNRFSVTHTWEDAIQRIWGGRIQELSAVSPSVKQETDELPPVRVSRLWVVQASIVFWLARWQVRDPTSFEQVLAELLDKELWTEALIAFRNGCFALTGLNSDHMMHTQSFLGATTAALSGPRVRRLAALLKVSSRVALLAAEEAVNMLGVLASHAKRERSAFEKACTMILGVLNRYGLSSSPGTVKEALELLKSSLPKGEFEEFIATQLIPILLDPIQTSLGGPVFMRSLLDNFMTIGVNSHDLAQDAEPSFPTAPGTKTRRFPRIHQCLLSAWRGLFASTETDHSMRESAGRAPAAKQARTLLELLEQTVETMEPTLQQAVTSHHFLELKQLVNYTVRTFEINQRLFESIKTLFRALSAQVLFKRNDTSPPTVLDTYLTNDIMLTQRTTRSLSDLSIAELCTEWILEPEVLACLVAGQILSFCENGILQCESNEQSLAKHFALSDLRIRIANSHRLMKLIEIGSKEFLVQMDAFWGTVCSEPFSDFLESLFPMPGQATTTESDRNGHVEGTVSVADSPAGVEDWTAASAVASPSLPPSILALDPSLAQRFFAMFSSAGRRLDKIITPKFLGTLLELPFVHYAGLAWTRSPMVMSDQFSIFQAMTSSEGQFFRSLALFVLACSGGLLADEPSHKTLIKLHSGNPFFSEIHAFFRLLLQPKRLTIIRILAFPSTLSPETLDPSQLLDPELHNAAVLYIRRRNGPIQDDAARAEFEAARFKLLRALDLGSLLDACPMVLGAILSGAFLRARAPLREPLMDTSITSGGILRQDDSKVNLSAQQPDVSKSRPDQNPKHTSAPARVASLLALLRSLRFRFLAALFRRMAVDPRLIVRLVVFSSAASWNDEARDDGQRWNKVSVDTKFLGTDLCVGQYLTIYKLGGRELSGPVSSRLVRVLHETREKLLDVAFAFLDLTVALHITQFQDIQDDSHESTESAFAVSNWPAMFYREMSALHPGHEATAVVSIMKQLRDATGAIYLPQSLWGPAGHPNRPIRDTHEISRRFARFAPMQSLGVHLAKSLTRLYRQVVEPELATPAVPPMSRKSGPYEEGVSHPLVMTCAATMDAMLLTTLVFVGHPLFHQLTAEQSHLWTPFIDTAFYRKFYAVQDNLTQGTKATIAWNPSTGLQQPETVATSLGSRAAFTVANTATRFAQVTSRFVPRLNGKGRLTAVMEKRGHVLDSIPDNPSVPDRAANPHSSSQTSVLRSSPTVFSLAFGMYSISSLQSVRTFIRELSGPASIWPALVADLCAVSQAAMKTPVFHNLPRNYMQAQSATSRTTGSLVLELVTTWLAVRSQEAPEINPQGALRKLISPDEAVVWLARLLRVESISMSEQASQQLTYPGFWASLVRPLTMARLAAESPFVMLRNFVNVQRSSRAEPHAPGNATPSVESGGGSGPHKPRTGIAGLRDRLWTRRNSPSRPTHVYELGDGSDQESATDSSLNCLVTPGSGNNSAGSSGVRTNPLDVSQDAASTVSAPGNGTHAKSRLPLHPQQHSHQLKETNERRLLLDVAFALIAKITPDEAREELQLRQVQGTAVSGRPTFPSAALEPPQSSNLGSHL